RSQAVVASTQGATAGAVVPPARAALPGAIAWFSPVWPGAVPLGPHAPNTHARTATASGRRAQAKVLTILETVTCCAGMGVSSVSLSNGGQCSCGIQAAEPSATGPAVWSAHQAVSGSCR